jgi:hypothetical protein
MQKQNNTLKTVPVIDKQELLFYIAAHCPECIIRIATNSGFTYKGLIVTIGKLKTEEAILVIQITSDKNEVTNNYVHLSLHTITAVELLEPSDVLNIFSLGKAITGDHYEPTGKLAVQREFQSLSTTIFDTHGVQVGVPVMELPADGLQLNRVLKTTQKIKEAIMELLKEEDARTSWKDRYNKITFVNKDTLAVTAVNDRVEISFAFDNIHSPEMPVTELTSLLMEVL